MDSGDIPTYLNMNREILIISLLEDLCEVHHKSRIIFLLVFFWSQLDKVTADFAFDEDRIETDDFKSLRFNGLLRDKSGLIMKILSHSFKRNSPITTRRYTEPFFGKSIIVHRPEGWGKTVNMNMLEAFFEIEVDSDGEPLPKNKITNDKLFIGGEIQFGNNETKRLEGSLGVTYYSQFIENLLGKHPVIFLRLKNVTGNSYNEIKKSIKSCITDTFEKHSYLMKSPRITDADKKKFHQYWKSRSANNLKSSLHFLSKQLYQHFHRDVIILIDDYDIPAVNSYLAFGENRKEFEKVRKLLVNLYTETIKTSNEFRKTTLLAGVLDIVLSKSSIFVDPSDAWRGEIPEHAENGVKGIFLKEFGNPFSSKYTCPAKREYCIKFSFQDYFGFDNNDIDDLLKKLPPSLQQEIYTYGPMRDWYNDFYYYMWESLYDPRAAMRYLSHNGTVGYYKSETNITRLINKIVLSDQYQDRIQTLAHQEENMIYHQVFSKDDPDQGLIRLYPLDGIAILYYSGYVRTKTGFHPRNVVKTLNEQGRYFFQMKVTEWLMEKFGTDVDEFRSFVGLLLARKMSAFKSTLQKYFCRVSSFIQGQEKETKLIFDGLRIAFYHVLSATHEVRNEDETHRDREKYENCTKNRVISYYKKGLSNTSIIIKQKLNAKKSKSDSEGFYLVNIDYSNDMVNITIPLQKLKRRRYRFISESKPLDETELNMSFRLSNITDYCDFMRLEDESL